MGMKPNGVPLNVLSTLKILSALRKGLAPQDPLSLPCSSHNRFAFNFGFEGFIENVRSNLVKVMS